MSLDEIIAYSLELYDLIKLQGSDDGKKSMAFLVNASTAESKKRKSMKDIK